MAGCELIDIVDENDVVIRTIERTPEWNKTRPDIYRYVHVYVWTTDGRLMLQQRARTKGNNPLVFDAAVGGLVSSGESYALAAQREMEEEIGLATSLKFVTPFKEPWLKTGLLSAHGHLFETLSDGPYQPDPTEVERFEFMTPAEMDHMTARYPYLFTYGVICSWQAWKAARKGTV